MREAELGIIGCVLMDNETLYNVHELIRPEMFVDEFCQDCYKEMLAMYDRSEPITNVGLMTVLENRKFDREEINGFLIDAIGIPNMASIEIKVFANTMLQDYKTRVFKKAFERVSMLPKDIENSMAEIKSVIEDLENNRVQSLKTSKQIVLENKDKYFCVKPEKMMTGFNKLDVCLNGLEKGDIVVIGARPAVGKSAISLQMIVNICMAGYRVGYYNLEMAENQIYERLLSMFSKLGLSRIKNSVAIIGQEQEILQKSNEKIASLNLVVGSTRKISAIKAEAKNQNYDLIVIDYLQLLEPERNNANRAVEVGSISKAAKQMAMELDVPVILLSQLHRKNQAMETQEPSMDELRESGDIEQDASQILLMWNLDDEHKYKGLKVDKNRQGTLTTIGLTFNGDNMRFEETDDYKQTVALAKGTPQTVVDENELPWDSDGE